MNAVGIFLFISVYSLDTGRMFDWFRCYWVMTWLLLFRVVTAPMPLASGWALCSIWPTPRPTSPAWTSCTTWPRWESQQTLQENVVEQVWSLKTQSSCSTYSKQRTSMLSCWPSTASWRTSAWRQGVITHNSLVDSIVEVHAVNWLCFCFCFCFVSPSSEFVKMRWWQTLTERWRRWRKWSCTAADTPTSCSRWSHFSWWRPVLVFFLRANYHKVRKEKKIHFFFTPALVVNSQRANAKVADVESSLHQLNSLSDAVAEYFCEDPTTFKLEECCSIFHSFCKRFDKAVQVGKWTIYMYVSIKDCWMTVRMFRECPNKYIFGHFKNIFLI